MSIKRKLIRNTIANYAIQIWTYVITFILFPFIILYIGKVEYGIYLLVAAIIGYFGLLDLGMGTSLVKFVAEYHTKDDKEKLNEVVNTAFFIFLGVGIIGAAGLFIVGTFFIEIFMVEPDLVSKARMITYILGVTFITGFSLSVFRNILAGLQRYGILAWISFGMSLLNVVVVVWVLLSGYGIVEYVLFTVIFEMLRHVLIVLNVRRFLPYLTIKSSYVNKNIVRSLFGLSLMLLFLTIFVRIVYYTDTLVIGYYYGAALGAAMITIYTAAWKISRIPGRAIDMTLSAMIPAASELDALKRERTLQLLLLRVTKYCLALIFLLAIPTLFMSKELLKYWLDWTGSDFSPFYLVTNILIIALFFDFFNYVSIQILIGMNKIKLFVACYGIVAVFNLFLSVVLIQRIGLEGVALGTTIPFIVMAPAFMWYSFKTIGISWKNYIRMVFFTTIPYAAFMGAVLFLLIMIHVPTNLIEVGVYYTISMVAYFIPFYLCGLNKKEKEDIKGIFQSLRYREDTDVG